jgi:hypothetical protein
MRQLGIVFAWCDHVMPRAGILAATASLLTLCGCTALGVSAASLGGAMVGAGAGAAVRAGTEYQFGGAVARTFPVPLRELRESAVTTFQRFDIELQHEPNEEKSDELVGRAGRRTVRMKFEAVTDVLTRAQVTVSRSLVVKDVATAEELLAQLEAAAGPGGVSALRRRSERYTDVRPAKERPADGPPGPARERRMLQQPAQ